MKCEIVKPLVVKLLKNFPTFIEPKGFIAVFRRDYHQSAS
jgi:hypothetical protein